MDDDAAKDASAAAALAMLTTVVLDPDAADDVAEACIVDLNDDVIAAGHANDAVAVHAAAAAGDLAMLTTVAEDPDSAGNVTAADTDRHADDDVAADSPAAATLAMLTNVGGIVVYATRSGQQQTLRKSTPLRKSTCVAKSLLAAGPSENKKVVQNGKKGKGNGMRPLSPSEKKLADQENRRKRLKTFRDNRSASSVAHPISTPPPPSLVPIKTPYHLQSAEAKLLIDAYCDSTAIPTPILLNLKHLLKPTHHFTIKEQGPLGTKVQYNRKTKLTYFVDINPDLLFSKYNVMHHDIIVRDNGDTENLYGHFVQSQKTRPFTFSMYRPNDEDLNPPTLDLPPTASNVNKEHLQPSSE